MKMRRLVAVFLAMILVLGGLPLSVFADPDPSGMGEAVETPLIPIGEPQNALSITLEEHRAEGFVGDGGVMNYTVWPEKFAQEGVTWRSSDESVATVDDHGYVSLVGAGEAVITVTTEGGVSDSCLVTVSENPVESLRLKTAIASLVCVENAKGRWATRYNPETGLQEEYYDYDMERTGVRDLEFEIVYVGGRTVTAKIGDVVDGHWFSISSNQYDHAWTCETENTITVSFMSREVQIPVTLVPNNVKSIALLSPLPQFTFIENAEGNWNNRWNEETRQDEEYFEYSLWEVNLDDLEFRITYTDDSTRTARFADTVDGVSFELENRQQETPWTVGGENYFYISFSGSEVAIPVTVTENPVASIALASQLPALSVPENSGGEWRVRQDFETGGQDEFYEYDLWRFDLSDLQILITYTDDSTKIVNFYDEVDGREFILESRQYDDHWTVGDENYFYITFSGREIAIPVTVTVNPVASIAPVGQLPTVTAVEYAGGRWETNWEGVEYYDYDLWDLDLDFDILITYTDGTTRVVNVNDDVDGQRHDRDSRQYDVPWTRGGDNTFTISFFGKEIVIPVTITENPVESIALVDDGFALEFVEHSDGRWNRSWDIEPGREVEFYEYDLWRVNFDQIQIRINFTDGTSTTARIDDEVLGQRVEWRDRQYVTPWTCGGENYFYIVYSGQTLAVPVNIIENPVKSIALVGEAPALTVTEGCDGHMSYRWNRETDQEEEYYYYDTWDLPMDELEFLITYTDGTSVTAGFYDQVDGRYFSREDRQEDDPWTVGGENYVYATFSGREVALPVTVLPNPVASIAPVGELPDVTCVEYARGHWARSWNDETQEYEEYFEYDPWDLDLGDFEILVTYTDGTTKTYHVNDDVDGRRFERESRQYDKHWTLGNENSFTLSFYGKEIVIPVTVVENPVDRIEINSAPTREYFLGDPLFGYDMEGIYILEPEDIQGLVFTVHYKDGTFRQIRWDEEFQYRLFYEGDTARLGEFPVTLEYMGKTAQYSVLVKESPVSDLFVRKLPDRTEYPTYYYPLWYGMEIQVSYVTGGEDVITITPQNSEYTFAPNGAFALRFTFGDTEGYILMDDDEERGFVSNILYLGEMCGMGGFSFVGEQKTTDVKIRNLSLAGAGTKATVTYDDGTQDVITFTDALDVNFFGSLPGALLYAETEKGFFIAIAIEYEDYYTVNVCDKQVKVAKNQVLYGDVNGDGLVNAKDVTALRRYLAGGYGVEINEANANVNGDSSVNAKDVTALRRYLAGGYGVVLGAA